MDGKFANLEAFLESYNRGPYVLDQALYEELASLVDRYFGLEDQIQFCEASVKDMFRAHEKSVQKFSSEFANWGIQVPDNGGLKEYLENIKFLVAKLANSNAGGSLNTVTQEEAFQSMLKLDAFTRENTAL